jgi:hypothetical protein
MNNFNKVNDLYPMPGETGYVAPEGNTPPDAPTPKEGEEGYVAPEGEQKPKEGEEGYVAPEKKPGEEGYVAPEGGQVAPKEGEEGYVAPNPDPKPKELTQEEKDTIFKQYLADNGFASIDEIKDLKRRSEEKPETPEEKEKRMADYNREMMAFGIKQNILTNSDIASIENLSKLEDKDIAYNEFAADFKEANKDRLKEGTNEPDTVTEEEIKTAFEEFFHLESDVPALKLSGEKMMKERAAAIRNASESKLANAKTKYDAEVHKSTHLPAFNNFLDQTIDGAIPEQLDLYGEGDSKIVFKLTNAAGKPLYDKQEIKKLFVADEVYNMYLRENDRPKLVEYINDTIQTHIEKTNKPAIRKLIYDQGKSDGLREGAVGAKVPFESKEKLPPVKISDTELTQADKNKTREQFQRKG